MGSPGFRPKVFPEDIEVYYDEDHGKTFFLDDCGKVLFETRSRTDSAKDKALFCEIWNAGIDAGFKAGRATFAADLRSLIGAASAP